MLSIRNFFQGTVPTSLGRFKPIFTKEMEGDLANHCRVLDSRFYGIGIKDLRTIAYQFADLNGLRHCFNQEKKMAGKDWVYAFCKRNDLSLRSPEKCSVGRAMGFNREQVSLFFKNLKEVFVKKKLLRTAFLTWMSLEFPLCQISFPKYSHKKEKD